MEKKKKIYHHFPFPLFLLLTLFFPAAEVMKPVESTKQRRLLPSPMLSPSFSSDEDSVYSSNQDFQLDELFDWDGQQQVGN